MAQIRTSELPTTDSLDYVVGIKDGNTSKAQLSSGSISYSSEEKLIGKWFDENLYERTIEINSIKSGSNTIDISSYGCSQAFVDVAHSFFRYDFDGEKWNYSFTPDITQSSITNLKNNNISLLGVSNTEVAFNVGSGMVSDFEKGYITIEYTKQ